MLKMLFFVAVIINGSYSFGFDICPKLSGLYEGLCLVEGNTNYEDYYSTEKTLKFAIYRANCDIFHDEIGILKPGENNITVDSWSHRRELKMSYDYNSDHSKFTYSIDRLSYQPHGSGTYSENRVIEVIDNDTILLTYDMVDLRGYDSKVASTKKCSLARVEQ